VRHKNTENKELCSQTYFSDVPFHQIILHNYSSFYSFKSASSPNNLTILKITKFIFGSQHMTFFFKFSPSGNIIFTTRERLLVTRLNIQKKIYQFQWEYWIIFH